MQDAYVGDVGDFGKYGLLRSLCAADKHGDALRLGVLWYRTDGVENHASGDGSHLEYIFSPSHQEQLLQRCDPDLFEKVRALVLTARTIAAVEASGVLPAGTVFFNKELSFARTPLAERNTQRRDWLQAGLRAVGNADVVFADPDNGLEVPSCSRLSVKGPKYAFYDDLRSCWERDQSLVIYHHLGRTIEGSPATAEEQIAYRCRELQHNLPGARPIALRYRRRSPRVYFLLSRPEHSERLQARTEALLASCWGRGHPPHFERGLYRKVPTA